MSYREILVPVISLEEDIAALTAAGEIAQKFGARAVALVVTVDLASAFADEASTFSEIMLDIAKGSQSHAAQEREKIVAWLKNAPHDFDVRDVTIESAVEDNVVLAHARMADLIVMARGPGHGRARRSLSERVLFRSGRPLLLTPSEPRRERKWERVLIGWSPKPEAVHAIAGALPLLQAAHEVVVATVDALPTKAGHGEAPGRELAAHLARHGVKVEVRNLDSLGRSEGGALLEEATNMGADAIVMGAYGHSRAQELVFGGVTRELLAASPTPLFMAH